MTADLSAYWQLVRSEPLATLIGNARCQLDQVDAGGRLLPIVIHTAPRDQSNVCSLRTHYIDYAREEIERILRLSGGVRLGLRTGLAALTALARACRLDDLVTVNNALLTTCLYPALPPGAAAAATRQLVDRHPTRAIAWRSLTPELNPTLAGELCAAGAKLLPWRSIYLHSPDASREAARLSRDAARDLKLAEHPPLGYTWAAVADFGTGDWARSAQLFRQLYLEKYSRYNPACSARFLRLCQASGDLRLIGLRAASGQLHGVLALYHLDGIQAAPLLGYDLTQPRDHALYRLLCARHWQEAMQAGRWIHQSAGVAEFKRSRRARQATEYLAVFYEHLPTAQRLAWHAFLGAIRHLAAPLTLRYEC